MPLRRYLFIMGFGTLISWGALVLVILNIDPFASGFIGLFSFYVMLFLSLMGTFSLFGFFVRIIFVRRSVLFRHIGVSLRQSVLFSLLIMISLMLQANSLFTWWNAILLILGLALLEFFFLGRETPKARHESHQQ
ncbi:hypothetical protein KJ810_00730 [Patescibacteria group bacterium]|nr:hypothetical protein [Patescibacteria group bacterium]